LANIHVLTKNGSEVTVAAHVAIPTGNNVAGNPWRTVLINSGIGGKTVMATGSGLGQITAAELATIATGALYETVVTLRIGTVQLANINAYLDGEFARISGEVQAALQDQLNFFGYIR
jgi:hypothetical protein